MLSPTQRSVTRDWDTADSCWSHQDTLQDLVNKFESDENSEDELDTGSRRPSASLQVGPLLAPKVQELATEPILENADESRSLDPLLSVLSGIAQVLSEQYKHAQHLHIGLEQHAKAVNWAEAELVKLVDSNGNASTNGPMAGPVSRTSASLALHQTTAKMPPPAPAQIGAAEAPTEPPPSLLWSVHQSTFATSTSSSLQITNDDVDGNTQAELVSRYPNEGNTALLQTGNNYGGRWGDPSSLDTTSLSEDINPNVTFSNITAVLPVLPDNSDQRQKRSGHFSEINSIDENERADSKNRSLGPTSSKVKNGRPSTPGPNVVAPVVSEKAAHSSSVNNRRDTGEMHLHSVAQNRVPTDDENGKQVQSLATAAQAIAAAHAIESQAKKGGTFHVLPIWNTGRKNLAAVCATKANRRQGPGKLLKRQFEQGKGRLSVALSRASMVDAMRRSTELESTVPSRMKRCPNLFSKGLHPYTTKRACWDIASLVLVVYDMIMIPMQLFEPPENLVIDIFTWTTRIFWSIDMILSFITGIVTSEGAIELRIRKIAERYVKTWFLLDLCIVGSDWTEYIIGDSMSGKGYARAGKASRAFRIVRMLRLLRLARMREVLGLILERIRSEKLIIVANVVKMTILLLGLAHIVACVWWGIGASSDEDDDAWVHVHGFTRRSLGYRYTMSLHWSLSQFAGGMDEVTPENTGERLYTITIFLLAFVVASLFVSSLTSSMTQLDIIGSKQSQELSVLRRYLYQNGISSKLALRVQRNAQHAILEQQRLMPEEAVTLLVHVSEPLRMELHFEMFSEPLSFHPWFRIYTFECPQVMRKVCHSGTSTQVVSSGDVIFNAGEIPAKPKMYFVTSGTLQYESMSGMETEVDTGNYVAEATLWTPWMHRGMLTASSDCRLCVLDSKKFQEIAGSFHHSMVDPEIDPRAYAADFVSALNASDEELTDLSSHVASTLQRKKSGTNNAKAPRTIGWN